MECNVIDIIYDKTVHYAWNVTCCLHAIVQFIFDLVFATVSHCILPIAMTEITFLMRALQLMLQLNKIAAVVGTHD